MPKFENCTFYSTAAEAEQAGYRPCLICRPELAPGTSVTDATASLLQRAVKTFRKRMWKWRQYRGNCQSSWMYISSSSEGICNRI